MYKIFIEKMLIYEANVHRKKSVGWMDICVYRVASLLKTTLVLESRNYLNNSIFILLLKVAKAA